MWTVAQGCSSPVPPDITASDPLLTQNTKKSGRAGRKQWKIRRMNGGKKHKSEPKRLRFARETTYGPEGRGFESLTACQKAREIQGFHELFLFSSAFVFPRKWSSRTAIRSGSILPQNTVTAAFACRNGKHDFYACVDQKNHRIFPLPKKLPAKNSDNFAVCGRIGVASVGKKL